MTRGSALIEVLVLGLAAALVVLTATVAAGRVQSAGEEATEVAQRVAQWAARYGDPDSAALLADELLPGATISITGTDEVITVVVRAPVSLVGPGGGPLRTVVTGRAEARMSPYRSHDG